MFSAANTLKYGAGYSAFVAFVLGQPDLYMLACFVIFTGLLFLCLFAALALGPRSICELSLKQLADQVRLTLRIPGPRPKSHSTHPSQS